MKFSKIALMVVALAVAASASFAGSCCSEGSKAGLMSKDKKECADTKSSDKGTTKPADKKS
ncbi:MAG: hypothetical protein K1X53_00745 [Candidatus Sumerlaeaceae bacterium]|nr:hypothetical protein [Candidatus Sumerlaeaceae bacterium]